MRILDLVSTTVRQRRRLCNLCLDQSGQDVIEYALLVSVAALGATASMHTVANGIGTAYTTVATHFSAYVSNSATPDNAGNGNGNGNRNNGAGQGNNGNDSNPNDNGNGNGNNGNGRGNGH